MMVGATGGAISGAATGAGTSGLDYLAKAGGAWNWSDLSRAMQTGATSGAVSGWLDGFVSPIIPAATENGILKVLAGAVVSAGADAAGLEAASTRWIIKALRARSWAGRYGPGPSRAWCMRMSTC